MIKILIVDDEVMICKSLQAGLSDVGYEVMTAQTSAEALKITESFKPHIVLTDMRIGLEDGIALIDGIKKIDPEIEVIVMTAYSDITSAVLAIKKGAFDYVNKPFELEQIKIVIARAFENFKLKARIYLLEKEKAASVKNLVGSCPKMTAIYDQISLLSKNENVTILIRGETGTGKELVADAIHLNSSRKDYPMLRINCCTIPSQLVESELFGFERNAFTGAASKKKGLFEIADGGTVFLDELGEIPLDVQAKLLRFLEERKFRRIGGLEDISVDIRVITATNKNLEEAVKRKEFREDLYYRVNVVPIELPPLREREQDVLAVARYFIEKYSLQFKKPVKSLGPGVEKRFLEYAWPGNIRELKNVIERLMILVAEDVIEVRHLPSDIQSKPSGGFLPTASPCPGSISDTTLSLEEIMDCIEKQYISEALEQTSGNQTKAAELLQISRFTLKRKLEKYQNPQE